ncbi:alpha-glucan water dikinase, chloroplastic [Nymphaea colorata]|nr:alpha-glucan water dikinase, chloroplastic [Nymphaea colorata]XP_031501424.1 alpha-glucan water dikinase, chloroplastic [Nymphaea colorata]
MSSGLGKNLFQKSLVHGLHTHEEQHIKSYPRTPGSSLCQSSAKPTTTRVTYQLCKPLVSCKFLENTNLTKGLSPSQGRGSLVSHVPCAVLATNPASEQRVKFNLDGRSELQIEVIDSSPGLSSRIDIQVSNSNLSLLLHWGVIRKGHKNWTLPPRRPDGTKVYKHRALRTPLKKSGDDSFLSLEVDDPEIEFVEFLLVDEAQNKWFKKDGGNFRVQLARSGSSKNLSSIPEELVQIQAYLRWERKGKQAYAPEQEKEEYEAARRELMDEVAKGVTIDDLRNKLIRNDSTSKDTLVPKSAIPDDLIQIQAYIRWEKAGKPHYSKDKQLMEFEEAKKELQRELDKGVSLDELRRKIMKGDIDTKVSKQLKTKGRFYIERITRKKRDILNLVNKFTSEAVSRKHVVEPKAPSLLELCSKSKEDQDAGHTLSKKIYEIENGELLVLVTKLNDKMKVYVATDVKEPLVLHWGLAKSAGQWMVPPASNLPPQSLLQDGSCETHFSEGFSGEPSLKSIEIEMEDGDFVGMPFVLRSGEKWLKTNDSDFYVPFAAESRKAKKDIDGKGTAQSLLNRIAELESEAQRSLMHRFNIATDLMEWAKDEGELGLAGILVWMRFMATRQLTWNKNYNVKPREISRAQDSLTDSLQKIFQTYPQYREIVRMVMFTVGRGGQGDVGQRIRDEILVIQRNNDCKGGMMEEWHQKLHNNTSPDDVVICQALIDYIRNDFDVNVYWNTLISNGITKERLLSYDRAIHSEPQFRRDQKEGLLRDLGNYMKTLKAVHSGADLESAIATCMGYSTEGQGFMVGVNIHPVQGLPTGFPELLQFVLDHVEDKNVEPLLEGLLEARAELRSLLLGSCDRLKDLIFLDLALDSTVRTAVERGYEELDHAEPQKVMYFITLVLENLALSSNENEDIVYCLKGWDHAIQMLKSKSGCWALFAKSVLDRTRLALATKAEHFQNVLQPSAEYLGSMLGVEQWALSIFTEEVIRAGSAASLSMLLNRIDPVLRRLANLGSWQVISPVEVTGSVAVVDELLSVQNKSYEKPTILIAKRVKGEEEIPDGTVAVLTPDMPDVLSHVSVRARNSKVCFATCFDNNILADLQSKEGKILSLKPTSSDLVYRMIDAGEVSSNNEITSKEGSAPSLTISRKQFAGKYAICAHEFSNDLVGAKSRNIGFLKDKVPSWVGIPTSVALPFGVFEKVISYDANKEIADKVSSLKKKLEEGEFNVLHEIRDTVLQLVAPNELVEELKLKLRESGMPWPGDEGAERWEQAWMAIKRVWASKWNERAYFSTRKVKLDHDSLCMAVLVQEIISADYAFVIHTTNPSSSDPSEIYAEVVRGLGETLVGAYPGRALSFICKKNDLNSPKILGYPSKPFGLFIRQSIIFRSDSNGEDLEGYAGAGLYDSVPMDKEEKVFLDYTLDPLITDTNFQNSMLSSIARAGNAIEELYGTPQDIEGVVKDGKIFVVQTRPQM